MNILTFDSHQKLHESAARIITGLVQTNPRAVIGLATGGTPVGIYKEIINSYQRGIVRFHNTTTFNLDEYVGLPEQHEQSYRSYMNTHLFDFVDLPRSQTHIPNGNAPDLAAECQSYDRLLDHAGRIDLQLLGLGHNGHIGFNEPDHTLINGTHIVELREETRQANARYFGSLDEVPTSALTMGVGTILKAKMILLVVKGKDKAEIIHRALTGSITPDCPASLLQPHSHLVVLLDSEAGGLFK